MIAKILGGIKPMQAPAAPAASPVANAVPGSKLPANWGQPVGPPPGAPAQHKGGFVSNFQHALDIVERPLNAITGGLTGAAKYGGAIAKGHSIGGLLAAAGHGAEQGFEGKTHNGYQDVLGAMNKSGKPNLLDKIVGYPANFVGDPINAAGGPLVKGIKGVAKVAGITKATKLAPGVTDAVSNAEKFNKAQPLKDLPNISAVRPVGTTAASVTRAAATEAEHGAPSVLPKPITPAAPVTPTLPRGLANASPRYKGFELNFPDHVTKALYIVGGAGKSLKHDSYMGFLREAHPGMPDSAFINAGNTIRKSIAPLTKEAVGTTINVPAHGINQIAEGALSHTAVPVEAVPKAPPVAVPKPAVIKPPSAITHDTMEAAQPGTLQKINDTVNARVVKEFDSSHLPSVLSKDSGLTVSRRELGSDQILRDWVFEQPEYKTWKDGIRNEETNKALTELNATQTAAHAATVAATTATPDVARTAAVADSVSSSDKAVVDAAAKLHMRNHGPDSLTADNMATLRQTLASKFYTANPGLRAKQKLPWVQNKITNLYKIAEAQVEQLHPLKHDMRLSDVLHTVKPDMAGDFHHLIGAMGGPGATLAQAAIHATGTADKSVVQSIMEGSKASGDATGVAMDAARGKPELNWKTHAAAAADLGHTVPSVLPVANAAHLLEKTQYAGGAMARIDKMFNTARDRMNQFQSENLKSAKGQVSSANKDSVETLRKIVKGADAGTLKTAYETAQVAERNNTVADGLAGQLQQYMRSHMGMLADHNVSAEEFKKFIPGTAAHEIGTEGLQSWAHTPLNDEAVSKTLLHNALGANQSTLHTIAARQLSHDFGAVVEKDGKATFEAAKKAGYVPAKNAPGLSGVLFPPELADKAGALIDTLKPGSITNNEFLKLYDKTTGLIKTGYTKYLPAHHVNNDIGQKFMAYMDGLKNPLMYTKALHVMKEAHAAKTGENLGHKATNMTTAGGIKLTGPEIHAAYKNQGLSQSFAGAADLAGDVPKVKSAIPTAVDKFSNAREDWNRLAHFMHGLQESKAKNLTDAAQESGMRVRANHAEYGDLTPFERNIMRRVIPFYTWQRKVAPELLRSSAAHPGRVLAYPKIQQLIGQMNGEKQNSGNFIGDPNDVMPDSMHEGLQVKYGSHNGNSVYGAFRTPFDDIIGKELNHPFGNLAGMASPIAKILYGLSTTLGGHKGQTFENPNIPITSKHQPSRLNWVEQQLPFLGPAMSITRRDPATGFTKPNKDNYSKDEKGFSPVSAMNKLLATGAFEDTKRVQQSAIREKQFKAKEAAKARNTRK